MHEKEVRKDVTQFNSQIEEGRNGNEAWPVHDDLSGLCNA
jgi:hypothetical protein